MKEFKNIIFDIDGTILDSYNAYMDATEIALKEVLNYNISDKEKEALFHLTNKQMQKKLGCSNEEYYKVNKRTDEIVLLNNVPLFEGIEKCIKKLKNDGYFLAVNTSRTKEKIINENSLNEIIKFFEFVVTSDMVVHPKPDKEPTELILNTYKLKKEETIMIGDSISDSISSNKAGISFALASWGARDKSVACNYYLETIDDIIKL